MTKLIKVLLLSIFLTGCATSAAIYKSGIAFEGKNVTKSTFGYSVMLNHKYKVELAAGCFQYVERAGMMSPVIPLPPVIPVGGKPESRSLQEFTLSITSSNGVELPTSDLKITLTIAGEDSNIKFVEKQVSQLLPQVLTYNFSAPVTCGSVKNGTLKIEGVQHQTFLYKINFYEGIQWEFGYLGG